MVGKMKGEFDWMKGISLVFGAMIVLSMLTYYGFGGESTYMDYVYTVSTNDTVTNLDSATNATHNRTFTLGREIAGETAQSYVTANVNNTNTTANATITVYLNGGSMGSYTALNGTVTAHNFTTYVQSQLVSGENTVLYVSDLATPAQKVTETTITYNSDVKDVGASPVVHLLLDIVMGVGILLAVLALIIQDLSKK